VKFNPPYAILSLLAAFVALTAESLATDKRRYIVQFQMGEGASVEAESSSLPAIKNLLADDSSVVELSEDEILRLKSLGNIRSIEEDQIYHAYELPNDPYFTNSLQYGLETTHGIDAVTAWDKTVGSDDIVVGVIDTGITLNHPDLIDNLWTNKGEIPNNNIDDDGDGYVDDVHGYNFEGENADPSDDNEHGTHVSGIIGARGDNSVGVVGVNWRVKLLPIKVLDSNGSGYLSTIAEGIDYAIKLKNRGVNIRVLNMSLGGGYSAALERALERAKNHGILVAAAAGNEGANNDSTPSYPANFPIDNILSVTATDQDGELPSFSNFGHKTVHLAAPGVRILSTLPISAAPSGYGNLTGTSMATPHVAGTAALIWAANPSLTMSQVRSIILDTVTPLSNLTSYTVTGGLLNANAAVSKALSTSTAFKISGKIKKDKRHGLRGVKVTLKGQAFTQSQTSGKDGTFSFDDVTTGTYTIKLRKSGYKFIALAKVKFTVGKDLVRNFSARSSR